MDTAAIDHNATALVIDARVFGRRHRAAIAWCNASEQCFSYMPTTKHLRLTEPSPG